MKEISEEQIKKAEDKFYSNRLTPFGSDLTDWMHGAIWMREQSEPKWISVIDQLPDELDECLFVVDLPNDHRHGKVYGGVYTGDPESKHPDRRNELSTPGISFTASHWQLLPNPPKL